MSLDDLTFPIEEVIKSEGTTRTGEELFWEAENFYRKNGELLAAHKRAAKEFQDGHGKLQVPVQLLTEIARWCSKIGFEGMLRVIDSYIDVGWQRDTPFAISNNSVAWLGRWLRDEGFEVDTRKSKMDEIWEKHHGVN